MQLFHFDKAPNFGDALNPWLWPRLLGPRLQPHSPTLFLGIGTILKTDLPPAEGYAVLGAGGGYGPFPRPDHRWRFYAVRGPLTARALDLPPHLAAIDAAYLIRRCTLPEPAARGPRIGFMPHWQTRLRMPWERICNAAGLRYLDPSQPVDTVIAEMRACDAVIAEAMHGAIVADALRIPWLPVRLGGQFLEFKWRDWLESIEVTCPPLPLPVVQPPIAVVPDESVLRRSWRRTVNTAAGFVQLRRLSASLRFLGRKLERDRGFGHLSSDGVMLGRITRLEMGLDRLLAAET